MSRVQLRRVDEAQNMRRFYSISIQPDLFGGFDVVREFGRIGSPGRIMTDRHATAEAAQLAMNRKRSEKEKGGYYTNS